MKLYDITRELFSAPVYPGDPAPVLTDVTPPGAPYTLHSVSQCLHNGTYLDAPAHFGMGEGVQHIDLQRCYGPCEVRDIASRLPLRAPRVLLRGDRPLTLEEARFYARQNALLVGVEQGTVGGEEEGADTHRVLLGAGTLILENLTLQGVADGVYTLCAFPLKIAGAEGSPVRAVLIKD